MVRISFPLLKIIGWWVRSERSEEPPDVAITLIRGSYFIEYLNLPSLLGELIGALSGEENIDLTVRWPD